jgi:hypothetical protein
MRPIRILQIPHPRQPHLPTNIPLHARLLPRHIHDPPCPGPHALPLCQLLRKIHPTQRIPHRPDLIANMRLRPATHILPRLVVTKQMRQVLGHPGVVGGVNEEAGALVRDLQRYAAALRRDDGSAGVQGLGDFDFEALARGELQGDGGVGHQRVEDLVRGADAGDDDVGAELRVQSADGTDCGLEDGRGVRVVDGAVAGDDELGDRAEGMVGHVFAAEEGVGGQDVGDACCFGLAGGLLSLFNNV